MDFDSAVQLYLVVLSWVKRAYELCFKTMRAFSFPYLDRIMWWIDLFVVSGVISNKLYHAVD
jgi:hypothetical protein